jgi:heme A synthase
LYVVSLIITGVLLLVEHHLVPAVILFASVAVFIISMFHTLSVLDVNYQPTQWPAIIALVIIIGGIVLTALGRISVADLMALITLALNVLFGKYGTATLYG